MGNSVGSTTQYSVHQFNPTAGTSIGQYMAPADFPGLNPAVYDIAYSNAGIWVARDETDSPIIRYSTEGVVTDYVSGTIVPAAAGLAIDPDGYLWVSDPVNDKIYKVETTTSISDASAGISAPGAIYPACNPFESVAFINAAGYPDGASVEVYDINGRTVFAGSVTGGSFTWNASSSPAGAYLIRVCDSGNSSVVRMVKTGI
jgi:hypothetical protein